MWDPLQPMTSFSVFSIDDGAAPPSGTFPAKAPGSPPSLISSTLAGITPTTTGTDAALSPNASTTTPHGVQPASTNASAPPTSSEETPLGGEKEGINIFVAGLTQSITDKGFEALFSQFGKIRSAKVMLDVNTGTSRGYGFLLFENEEDGRRAMQEMDGKPLGPNTLHISISEHDGHVVRCNTIYVRNLPLGVSEREVVARFAQVGPIVRITLKRDNSGNYNTQGKYNLACIEFKNADDAQSAIKLAHGNRPFEQCLIPLLAKFAESVESRESRRLKRFQKGPTQLQLPPPPAYTSPIPSLPPNQAALIGTQQMFNPQPAPLYSLPNGQPVLRFSPPGASIQHPNTQYPIQQQQQQAGTPQPSHVYYQISPMTANLGQQQQQQQQPPHHWTASGSPPQSHHQQQSVMQSPPLQQFVVLSPGSSASTPQQVGISLVSPPHSHIQGPQQQQQQQQQQTGGSPNGQTIVVLRPMDSPAQSHPGSPIVPNQVMGLSSTTTPMAFSSSAAPSVIGIGMGNSQASNSLNRSSSNSSMKEPYVSSRTSSMNSLMGATQNQNVSNVMLPQQGHPSQQMAYTVQLPVYTASSQTHAQQSAGQSSSSSYLQQPLGASSMPQMSLQGPQQQQYTMPSTFHVIPGQQGQYQVHPR